MDERPDESAPSSRLRWALRAAVVLPMAVAAIRALATGWFPVGDSALLAIRAYDVGTEHHPLLGSWTSASLSIGTDVNNPGPLYADLLAPFMWTIGRWFGIGPAVAVGVASINAGFALVTAWVGNRLGGWRVERWTLLVVAALGWAMGSELLIDIWQPHALLLPFACLLFLTVGLVDQHWSLLPWWLAVASLIVQTHIGYVYVLGVFGLLVAAVAGVAVRQRATRSIVTVEGPRRLFVVSAAVVVLAWLQPVIEQFFGEGQGNLARLVSNAGGSSVTIGGSNAVRIVAEVLVVPPWWTRFAFEGAVPSTPLSDTADGPALVLTGLLPVSLAAALVAALIGLLAWLTVTLWRRGRTLPAAAALLATVGTVAGVLTLTIQTVSTVGLGAHHVRWLFVISLFVQVTVVWAVAELGWLRSVVNARLNEFGPWLVAAVVGSLVIANLPFHAHDLGPTADREAAGTLDGVFDQLEQFDPDGPVLYDVSNLRPFEAWSSAVQMRMRELAIDFRVDDEGVVRQLGNGRRADGSEVTTVSQVERGAALDVDGCVIARSSSVDPVIEARIDGLIDAAVDDLTSGAVVVDASGLGDGLPERFDAVLAGDGVEARILVADGVLAFMAADGRIERTTPAVEAVVAEAALVAERVGGTLVLLADPPVDCL